MILRSLTSALCATMAFAFSAGAAQYNLNVDEDTAPYSFVPTLARYNNETLYAFQSSSEMGFEHNFETYLRFPNLDGVIPAGEVITSAKLLFYYAFNFEGFGTTSTDPGDIYCHAVTQGWDQTTLTWANRPTIDPTALDSSLGITAFGLLQCDVTSAVLDWESGTLVDNGFALVSPTQRVLGMWSSEANVSAVLKPVLVINTANGVKVPGLPPVGLLFVVLSLTTASGIALRMHPK